MSMLSPTAESSILAGHAMKPVMRGGKKFLQISQNSRRTLTNCARRFEFTKLYQHPRQYEKSLAADAGTAIHEGYQEYLTSRDEQKAIWALMRSYPTERNYDPYDDRSLEACFATLQAMIEYRELVTYELARIKKFDGTIVPAVEVPFEITLSNFELPNGWGVQYIGFIDCVLFDRFADRYIVVDIKTHRNRREDLTGEYKFHGQTVPYGLVIQHITGEALNLFDVAYLTAFVDLRSPRPQLYKFTKDKEAIQDWIIKLVLDLRHLSDYIKLDHFPRTEGGCITFNTACQFLDVCASRNKDVIQRYFLLGQEGEDRMNEDVARVAQRQVAPRPEAWIKFDVEIPVTL
jgi:hypothetical protein